MTTGWSADDLHRIDATRELAISVPRVDGSPGGRTPIWVVCFDRQVYVRSWYRRSSGWFGRALQSGRAEIWASGLSAEVTVHDIGASDPGLRQGVDAAYRRKYGPAGSSSMIGDRAAATTLRLDRHQASIQG